MQVQSNVIEEGRSIYRSLTGRIAALENSNAISLSDLRSVCEVLDLEPWAQEIGIPSEQLRQLKGIARRGLFMALRRGEADDANALASGCWGIQDLLAEACRLQESIHVIDG
ncbi:hypothetical protein, partial [Thioalkalivibrio thiocyanodenitrificans]